MTPRDGVSNAPSRAGELCENENDGLGRTWKTGRRSARLCKMQRELGRNDDSCTELRPMYRVRMGYTKYKIMNVYLIERLNMRKVRRSRRD
jgi:hypothetical protein